MTEDLEGAIPTVREALQELRYFADPALPTNQLGNLITMLERADKSIALLDQILQAVPIADSLDISLERVGADKTLYADSRHHEQNIWNAAALLATITKEPK